NCRGRIYATRKDGFDKSNPYMKDCALVAQYG
ncbi:unnamed protein product, partial [marine sediment metagenome]